MMQNDGGSPRGDHRSPVLEQGDEISFLSIVNLFLRHRYLVLGLSALLGVLTVGFSMLQDRSYRAYGSFVPNSNGQPRGQLIGLAAQFGVNIGGSETSGTPAFYAALLTSRDILLDAVRTEYRLEEGGEVRTGNLVQFLDLDDPELEFPPGVTREEAAMEELKGRIGVGVDLETSIVGFSVDSPDRLLAEQVAERLVALVQGFDLEKRQTQASARRRFSEARLQEARASLRQAENALEEFASRNRIVVGSPVLLLEQNRLQQEVLLKRELFASLSQAYEQARIDEVRNTPVITVLEAPGGTGVPIPRYTILKALLAAVIGTLLALTIGFVRDQFARSERASSSDFSEYAVLRASIVRDLRRLRPWRAARNGAAVE